jgi:UDP-3-O-[3-hydroxymyristoyl] glucosamine N-acyltransferase
MPNRTAGDLAQFLACPLQGRADVIVAGVASPEAAESNDVIYLESSRYRERAVHSAAQCVITSPDLLLPEKTLILAAHPKLAFVRAAAWLNPAPHAVTGVHATAVIAKSAHLGVDTVVGPYAVIEDEVEIGDGTQIDAFCFVGRSALVGSHCHLHPRVTVYPGVKIGRKVEVHSGAVLGCDGFGYVTEGGKHWKFPQLGTLEICDDVAIGANTTIAKGSLGVTSLGSQVKIDNLVHLAHNVTVGERTIIAAQTGVAGSSAIEKDVLIGGQVGIGDHCRLEAGTVAGSQAGIPSGKVIRRGQRVWGTPARPIARFKEQYGWFARLPELADRILRLEREGGSKSPGERRE